MQSDRLRRGAGDAAVYETLRQEALRIAIEHPAPERRLQPLTDALWTALHPRGISWIGF